MLFLKESFPVKTVISNLSNSAEVSNNSNTPWANIVKTRLTKFSTHLVAPLNY